MNQQSQRDLLMRRAFITLRLSLAIVFIYSGLEKIARPHDFQAIVYDFDLVGLNWGLMVAAVLPWLELVFASALLLGYFTKGAFWGISGLGLVFLIVQLSAIGRGLTIKCGCFGTDEGHFVGRLTLIRTLAIFAASVALWIWSERQTRSRDCEGLE